MIYFAPWSDPGTLKSRLLASYDFAAYENPDWGEVRDPERFYPFDAELPKLATLERLSANPWLHLGNIQIVTRETEFRGRQALPKRSA